MINNNIDVEKVICNLNKRKFQGVFVQNSAEALKKICELIPAKASVGFGGSITAEQIGIQKNLLSKETKYILLDFIKVMTFTKRRIFPIGIFQVLMQ